MNSIDITKCTGENCDKKNKCYRFLAKENIGWQSWLIIKNIKDCSEFLEIKRNKKIVNSNISQSKK